MSEFNTDHLHSKTFHAHGRISMSLYDDGILLYRALGPFNLELIEALADLEFDALIDFQKTFDTWCEVVVFEESSLIVQDAQAVLDAHLKSLSEQKLTPVVTALVFPEGVIGGRFMPAHYEAMYAKANQLSQSFVQERDALAWVREQLAAATKP